MRQQHRGAFVEVVGLGKRIDGVMSLRQKAFAEAPAVLFVHAGFIDQDLEQRQAAVQLRIRHVAQASDDLGCDTGRSQESLSAIGHDLPRRAGVIGPFEVIEAGLN